MRLTLQYLILALTAAALYAQSNVLLDNASVRVVNAIDRPHQKGALHKHDRNRVMIYLNAGDLDITTEDGRVEHQHWKAGDVAWSPAGGLHTSENVGTEGLHIIEIELKNPGPASSPVRNPGLDPLRIDSSHNKLAYENPQVRVFHSELEVGGREKWHEHAGAGRLAVLLTPLAARMEVQKRQSSPMNGGPGDVFWSEGGVKHRSSNLGHKAAEVVVVEVK